MALTNNRYITDWVEEQAKLCKPDQIVWIDGSEEQLAEIRAEGFATGELIKLNEELLPGCVYHRSALNDVARVEARTFICCEKQEDAGPTNNWMDPQEMRALLRGIYDGCMRGRTMYVIPYAMGIVGSPFAKYGIELTDSIYVVVSMAIMTRVGTNVYDAIQGDDYIKGLHAKAELDEKKRYIVHFPQDNTIMSVNSGYGGNVLLGKKCFALRIASCLGRDEGWLAEHMLILGVENPQGEVRYVCGAFPSACGKTNLAMLIPPQVYREKGWKCWCVGDDIAWLRPGPDGRLWAVNPENGFFGVAPGTSMDSNPNALHSCKKGTIFTNVVLTPEGDIWWEDMGVKAPKEGIDWKGNPCYVCADDPYRMGPKPGMTKAEIKAAGYVAAHKNSRFTAPAENCPVLDKDGFNGKFQGKNIGVPLDAMLFGGRRPSTIPLVNQAKDWAHGVFMGSAAGSEVTAAIISNDIGKVRRDPMAMLPFFGYNVCDYFQHWLEMERLSPDATKLPKIFFVNWFRKTDKGEFMWPGFGDNSRVLKWICDRIEGKVKAQDTPIGYLPFAKDISLENNTGKDTVNPAFLKEILKVDVEGWKKEIEGVAATYAEYEKKPSKDSTEELAHAPRIPRALKAKLAEIQAALAAAK